MIISTKYLWSFYLLWAFVVAMAWGSLRAQDIPLAYHGKFFTCQGTDLSEQDAMLVNQMIDITQLPCPIIRVVEKADSCGAIHVGDLKTSDGTVYATPYITLCNTEWNLLSSEEKSFILCHEAAHYMLGHCHEKDPAWVSHIVSRCGKEALVYLGAIACGFTLGAINHCFDIVRTKNFKAARIVFPLAAVSAFCYGCCRNYMAHRQRNEYEADMAACTYLHSASGGIQYFQRRSSLSDKAATSVYARFMQKLQPILGLLSILEADYGKLSTHPSDDARIACMRWWQKKS